MKFLVFLVFLIFDLLDVGVGLTIVVVDDDVLFSLADFRFHACVLSLVASCESFERRWSLEDSHDATNHVLKKKKTSNCDRQAVCARHSAQ